MRGAPQYLLAIYITQHRQDPPIPSGAIAEMLDRSPAAVTEMCQRLGEKGLVTYEPYEGVTLTESGRERAMTLHETYVTVSWFFRGVLELDDYESEAMEVAGLVSPAVAERLADTLPHPDSGARLEIDGTDDAPTDNDPT
ncbi:metal-dependent transcriptional regulator [Haloarcula sp. S1CR25-12]|uniref:Metal-dependent transcriptional regulator n=1 Tax=Haloarcula saliterrae TaxID=2950534 RepID=A0ABU2FGQ7_9EURY|nr:metal-dependent transcriptional regulator [Haloarcula sp. S1CR25-12]MDS0260986.1 metal-dependent transcriptional regulator [Haloarcula sp. S1CR25-12]